MKKNTPYSHYQNTEEWAIIEKLLNDLTANQDIELKTAPEYELVISSVNWEIKTAYCWPSSQGRKKFLFGSVIQQ
ncbi:MAG: hypothetical protein MRECE_3c053 [Mycoplasmataceae bacterium CE_OT135]|nr:MAG: hypothetical protein MRECE_3c053 [Mycoplasmataceae bacterium CE_OT135]